MERKRNLDHLKTDESIYDVIISQIPFSAKSSIKSINEYFLNNGIQNNDTFHITYADKEFKNEMQFDFILSTIIPNKWWDDFDMKDQEYPAYYITELIFIDIMGNFKHRELKDRLIKFYANKLNTVLESKDHNHLNKLKKEGEAIGSQNTDTFIFDDLNIKISDQAQCLNLELVKQDIEKFQFA